MRTRTLLAVAAGAAAAWIVQRLATRPPSPQPIGTPLDGVNEAFHRNYDAACSDEEQAAPVFVVLADLLVTLHEGGRRELPITPRLTHVIKSAAHAPVALFAALHGAGNDAIDAPAQSRVGGLRRMIDESIRSLEAERGASEPGTRDDALRDIRQVLERTTLFIDRIASEADPGRASALHAFARDVGPLLLRLTEHATRLQLDALDSRVGEALSALTVEQQTTLQVVITGDHQARARSLGMQYFRKRFGEEEGEEERVAYAEGVTDVDEALALVGKRRLNAVMAEAFFADPKRLQWDVLGDAVKAALAGRDLARIG